MSASTAGVILRALVNLEARGGDEFFGEPEFDPADLLTVEDGKGVVTLLELADQQADPTLFSTFLMWLLAELFEDLPEAGDIDKPKLVFFFDEAHLLFADASKAFLDRIEQTVKLIRSKGVGVFFCTQLPDRHPQRRPVPARRPGAARAARLHPGRPEGPDEDRADLPEVEGLRHRGGADLAGDRRGHRHGALRAGRADAGGVDPAAAAALADGRDRRARGDRGGEGVAAAGRGTGRRSTGSRPTSGSPRGRARTRRRRPRPRPVPADQPPQAAPPQAPPPSEDEGPGLVEKAMANPVFKSFLRSAASAAGREITRGVFGTARRRR